LYKVVSAGTSRPSASIKRFSVSRCARISRGGNGDAAIAPTGCPHRRNGQCGARRRESGHRPADAASAGGTVHSECRNYCARIGRSATAALLPRDTERAHSDSDLIRFLMHEISRVAW
jgi:hypothetical protein